MVHFQEAQGVFAHVSNEPTPGKCPLAVFFEAQRLTVRAASRLEPHEVPQRQEDFRQLALLVRTFHWTGSVV